MILTRRSMLTLGGGFLVGTQGLARGADWPERPLRMVIGYPPGGATDGVARALLAPLMKALGQPVVMEYKPGAGGATAAEHVARSAPDGYTLHLIEGSVFTALPQLRKLGFDPVRSLQPIGMAATGGVAIVATPSIGLSTIADLIDAARASPGKLSYGTSGAGGAQHLVAELFQSAARIQLQHVPYKGGSSAMNDLLGGQIQLLFSSMTPAIPMVKAGRIKALGVTSRVRSSSLPDVATVAEQAIPGFDAEVWLAIVAPAGVPDAVAGRLRSAFQAAIADPNVQAQVRSQGYEPTQSGPTDISERIQVDSLRWSKIIKEAGVTLE